MDNLLNFILPLIMLQLFQYSSCSIATSSCSQPPYPQVCNHFIKPNPPSTTSTLARHFSKQMLSQSDDGFPEWFSSSDRKLLRSSNAGPSKADIVVAKDGSGNYKTISEAVAALPKGSSRRLVVYVKAGVYNENVEITMKNIMFIGDGIDQTTVTGNRSKVDGSSTYDSATFGVSGEGFIAQGITFENTAGPQKYQAVALRSSAEHSVFYRCSFKGYQDTLYVYSNVQFYRECDVYGTIDFIFGNGKVVLQNCNIYARKPMSEQVIVVTAQSRADPTGTTGIVIHNSRIAAAEDLRPVQGSFRTYLGRPWGPYSRTVVMKCNLEGLVDPAGWLPWNGSFGLSTLYYGEYLNYGAGAATEKRVKWAGYHVITSAVEAGNFTVETFLDGKNWIPGTGVPYSGGI